MVGIEENVSDHGDRRERRHRNIQGVIAYDDLIGTGLVFDERLVMRTIHFRQKVQRHLQEKDHHEAQPERIRAEGFAEVIGKAGAEGVGQRGEEEQERAEKF